MDRKIIIAGFVAAAGLLWWRGRAVAAGGPGVPAIGGSDPAMRVLTGAGLEVTRLPPAPGSELSVDPVAWRPGASRIDVIPAWGFEAAGARRRGLAVISVSRVGSNSPPPEFVPTHLLGMRLTNAVLPGVSQAIDGSAYPASWRVLANGGALLPYPSAPGQPGRAGDTIRSAPGFSEAGIAYVNIRATTNFSGIRSGRGLIQYLGTDGTRFALMQFGESGRWGVAPESEVARRVTEAAPERSAPPTAAEAYYYRLPYSPPASWPWAPPPGRWAMGVARQAREAAAREAQTRYNVASAILNN